MGVAAESVTGARRLLAEGGGARLVRRVVLHERFQLAVKAAAAAVLAWLAASAFSPDLERFRYYAPLGAVVTSYPTIATTARQSWHTVLSVAAGAALGLTVHAWAPPTVIELIVVVGLGVAIAGLPVLGEQSSYVPIVAVLVVAIGGAHPGDYALAYLALTGVGAAIGIIVSLAIPSTRLSPGYDAVRRVERLLADRLAEIAEVLRRGEPPGAEEWEHKLAPLAPAVGAMRRRVGEAVEAQRGNPRAWLRGYPARRELELAQGLEGVHALVVDLVKMLGRMYRVDRPQTPLAPDLAESTADALDGLSELVRDYHLRSAPDDDVVAARAAVDRLLEVFSRTRSDPEDLALLGAVVATIQRCLDSVVPAPSEGDS